ncbi:MAG: hypothetical protein J0H44_25335 [Alphaproteobacteria bacterium]|nr:hypothetical protein [Alphaproteobacteria bacterium]
MITVMFGVVLAGLAGVMDGMGRVAVCRMGVVRGLLVGVGLVVLGRLTMMLGSMLVVLGRVGVMFDDLLLGHEELHRQTAPPMIVGQGEQL